MRSWGASARARDSTQHGRKIKDIPYLSSELVSVRKRFLVEFMSMCGSPSEGPLPVVCPPARCSRCCCPGCRLCALSPPILAALHIAAAAVTGINHDDMTHQQEPLPYDISSRYTYIGPRETGNSCESLKLHQGISALDNLRPATPGTIHGRASMCFDGAVQLQAARRPHPSQQLPYFPLIHPIS